MNDEYKQLTRNEQNVLDYHRSNLRPGRYMQNSDGSITTFKGALVGVPGGYQLVPTYWNGKVVDNMDDIYSNIKRSGISFPIYKTESEAMKAEQRLHKYMENDIRKMSASSLGRAIRDSLRE